jgi:hypothetical protein
MTAPGTQGEVSPESMAKTAASAVGSPPDAKPASPRTPGNHAEQNRLKPCRGKPFDLWKELKFERQKGNSPLGVLNVSCSLSRESSSPPDRTADFCLGIRICAAVSPRLRRQLERRQPPGRGPESGRLSHLHHRPIDFCPGAAAGGRLSLRIRCDAESVRYPRHGKNRWANLLG